MSLSKQTVMAEMTAKDFPDNITVFLPVNKGVADIVANLMNRFLGRNERFSDFMGFHWYWSYGTVGDVAEYLDSHYAAMEGNRERRIAFVTHPDHLINYLRLAYDLDMGITIYKCSVTGLGLVAEGVSPKDAAAQSVIGLAEKANRAKSELVESARVFAGAITDKLKEAVAGVVVDLTYFVRDEGEDWSTTLSETGVSLRYADIEYDGSKHFDWTEVPHYILAQILKDPSVTELFNVRGLCVRAGFETPKLNYR